MKNATPARRLYGKNVSWFLKAAEQIHTRYSVRDTGHWRHDPHRNRVRRRLGDLPTHVRVHLGVHDMFLPEARMWSSPPSGIPHQTFLRIHQQKPATRIVRHNAMLFLQEGCTLKSNTKGNAITRNWLYLKAPIISPCKAQCNARVIPQPGHFNPVNTKNGHRG